MTNTIIKLSKALPLSPPVAEIEIREPSGKDFFDLGAPTTLVQTPHGMALVENEHVIKAYIERCVVKPDPLVAIKHLNLKDARAVKGAVLGFFDETEKPSTSSVTT